jgi:transmembrane sensor
VAQVNPERITAWRTGMIKFDSVALEDVIEDVNRYTDKPLVIANDSLRRLPISGRFRVGDTESVRFLLRERFDVESSVEGERIVLR